MKRKLLGAAACAAAAVAVGCTSNGGEHADRFRTVVDPCWPERYNHQARLNVLSPFQAQAANGATLNATVWNYHFEAGTDKLTPAGQQRLIEVVQKRPAPDSKVYIQTAHDVSFDAAAPEKFADTRRDLDQRRSEMVQKYLAAQTASRPMAFEVQAIDPVDPAFGAQYTGNAVRSLVGQYKGSATGGSAGGGGGSSSGGGAAK